MTLQRYGKMFNTQYKKTCSTTYKSVKKNAERTEGERSPPQTAVPSPREWQCPVTEGADPPPSTAKPADRAAGRPIGEAKYCRCYPHRQGAGAPKAGSASALPEGTAGAARWRAAAGWRAGAGAKATEGGAKVLAKNYIDQGQYTIYYQRFNLRNGENKVGTHQYMTNIMAPYSEALSTKNSYVKYGITDQPLVFEIPIYNSMPKSTKLP